ncbi:hypothetical protein ACLOJK_036166 [Asimina triloba]
MLERRLKKWEGIGDARKGRSDEWEGERGGVDVEKKIGKMERMRGRRRLWKGKGEIGAGVGTADGHGWENGKEEEREKETQ